MTASTYASAASETMGLQAAVALLVWPGIYAPQAAATTCAMAANVTLSVAPPGGPGTVKLWVTTAVAPAVPDGLPASRPLWVSTSLMHTTDTLPVPVTPGRLWLKVTAICTDAKTGVTGVLGTAVLERCTPSVARQDAPLVKMRAGAGQQSAHALVTSNHRLRIEFESGAVVGLRSCNVEDEATGPTEGGTMIETAWPVPTTAEMGWALLGVDVYDARRFCFRFEAGLVSYFYRGVVLLAAGQTRGPVPMLEVVQRLAAAVARDAKVAGPTTTLDALVGAMLQGAGGDYHSETEDDRGNTLVTLGTNADCDDFACSAVLLANTLLKRWPCHRQLGRVAWPVCAPGAMAVHQAMVALLVQTCDHLCATYREGCVVYGVSKSPSRPKAGRFGHAWAALMRKCPANTYNLAGALHLECTAPVTQAPIPGLPGNRAASVVAEQVAQAKAQGCGGAKQALYAGTRVADAAAMEEYYPVFYRAVFADAAVRPAHPRAEVSWQDVRCGRVMMKTMTGAPDTTACALRTALYHRAGPYMMPEALPTGVTELPAAVGAAWAVAPGATAAPAAPGDVAVSWDTYHRHMIRPRLRPSA